LPDALPPPDDKGERTSRAIEEQCLNSRMPGYTGFLPSARAEDVYGRTQAAAGRASVQEQERRHRQRQGEVLRQHSEPPRNSGGQSAAARAVDGRAALEATIAPDEHPLGRSRAGVTRNHWVPTIPGYGGFIPGKEAENVCGGGMAASCKMAGRAIAERRSHTDDALGDDRAFTPERHRIAAHLRDHCSRQIPGYMGHVPRIHGESIIGGTVRAINLIAADLCEDRAFNPLDHGATCCAPQFPEPRKLRM